MKPRTDYAQLAEQIAVHWEQNPVLRVPNLTAARRLLAEDGVWRAVLDVNAAVKLFARSDETLPERFAFLTEALTSARSGSEPTVPFPITPAATA